MEVLCLIKLDLEDLEDPALLDLTLLDLDSVLLATVDSQDLDSADLSLQVDLAVLALVVLDSAEAIQALDSAVTQAKDSQDRATIQILLNQPLAVPVIQASQPLAMAHNQFQ